MNASVYVGIYISNSGDDNDGSNDKEDNMVSYNGNMHLRQ